MNVAPGQLARVVAPRHPGNQSFVVVRRPYRGEGWVGGFWWPIDFESAWICEGRVRFFDPAGRVVVVGPSVVLADAILIPVVGLRRADSRDLTVTQTRRA